MGGRPGWGVKGNCGGTGVCLTTPSGVNALGLGEPSLATSLLFGRGFTPPRPGGAFASLLFLSFPPLLAPWDGPSASSQPFDSRSLGAVAFCPPLPPPPPPP